MITRYFDATIEDATRIAVVTASTVEDCYDTPEAQDATEISEDRLPDDFKTWKRYTTHGYSGLGGVISVEVLSRDGD